MKSMTLRLPDDLYERVRQTAFDRRVPISSLLVAAVEKAHYPTNGCDVCGKPATHVTTPGGLRGCDDHLRGATR